MDYLIFTSQNGIIDLDVYTETPISMLDTKGVQILLMSCEKNSGYMSPKQVILNELVTDECQERLYNSISKYISLSEYKELLKKLLKDW